MQTQPSPAAFPVISGLPRAGSTLLAAILRQNPDLHAGMSSPVVSLALALQRQLSQENEGAPFVTDAKREAVLRGAISGYYADLPATRTILDTNRGLTRWSTPVSALRRPHWSATASATRPQHLRLSVAA